MPTKGAISLRGNKIETDLPAWHCTISVSETDFCVLQETDLVQWHAG